MHTNETIIRTAYILSIISYSSTTAATNSMSLTNSPLLGFITLIITLGFCLSLLVIAKLNSSRKTLLQQSLASAEQLNTLSCNLSGLSLKRSTTSPFKPISLDDHIEKLSGYTTTALLLNDNFVAIVHEDDKEPLNQAIEKTLNGGGNLDIEYRIKHRDGSIVWLAERSQPAAQTKQGHYIESVIFDISKSKENELRLKEITQDLNSANQAKSELLSSMSHEIRTPINAIIGMTNICLKTSLSSQQISYLNKAILSSKTLLTVIGDILDLSNIEENQFHIEQSPFTSSELQESVAGVVGTLGSQSNIDVLLDFDIPEALLGDLARLNQVLLSLISNIMKSTKHGQIVVKARMKSRSENKLTIVFSLSYTGLGTEKDQQATVFKPFSQFDPSFSESTGGTEIGLLIIKKIVELMGGEIYYDGNLNTGIELNFTTTLKLDKKAIDKHQLSANLNVLLVSHNNLANEILSKQLVSIGAKTKETNSADQALDILRSGNDVDFVIIDYRIPKITGIELAKKIINSAYVKPSQVIIQTGYDDYALRYECLQVGMKYFLHKPIILSELFDCLETETNPKWQAEEHKEKNMESYYPDLNGYNILVAEDNFINQELAVMLLEEWGASVLTALNGKEAVSVVENNVVDVILMDIQMPEMDGIEATKAIRATYDKETLPIIAVTAEVMPKEVALMITAGMNSHVAKPLEEEVLYKEIYAHLPRKSEMV